MTRTYRIGVMQGDGIGPEIVPATVRILDAAAAMVDAELFDWVHLPMGWEAIEKHGTPMPDDTVVALEDCDGWIIGPHDNQAYPPEVAQARPPGGELRNHYDLYANIRPCRNFPGIEGVVTDTDLVVVRENTEGFYADRNMHVGVGEFMPTPDVAMSVGVFTRPAIERIAHTAFRLASGRRKKVTIVHKTNVLKLTTGLFREVSLEVAREYPDVEVDELLVDAATAHLVRRAASFDVILTENMFGDILSDLAGELVGALGLSPSINASYTHAMAQAAHGSAPDIAGQGLANPVGIILSSVMLLRWLAERHDDDQLQRVADAVESGVWDTLAAGMRTADLGGAHRTDAFADAIAERIGRA
jgi:3-isopropylmalate dehydrogenase